MPGRTEGWGSDHTHQWRTGAWTCPHGSYRALAKGIIFLCPCHTDKTGHQKELVPRILS